MIDSPYAKDGDEGAKIVVYSIKYCYCTIIPFMRIKLAFELRESFRDSTIVNNSILVNIDPFTIVESRSSDALKCKFNSHK